METLRNSPTNNVRDDWDDEAMVYRGYDHLDQLVEERPYSPEEVAELQEETTRKTLEQQGLDALVKNQEDIARNNAALAVDVPTNAQVVAQVKELTRQSTYQAQQLNALIRLVLNQMD